MSVNVLKNIDRLLWYENEFNIPSYTSIKVLSFWNSNLKMILFFPVNQVFEFVL